MELISARLGSEMVGHHDFKTFRSRTKAKDLLHAIWSPHNKSV